MVIFTALISYTLPFSRKSSLPTFSKDIILQRYLSCWYPIWKTSISIVFNIDFGKLLERRRVNEDCYGVLAQIITFRIVLKSDMFENKANWEITKWKFIQAWAEIMRAFLHKKAEFSFRTVADWLGLKERNHRSCSVIRRTWL